MDFPGGDEGMTKVKNILLTLLSLALLVGFAAAVPSPAIDEDALSAYQDQASFADDEYAFLFDN